MTIPCFLGRPPRRLLATALALAALTPAADAAAKKPKKPKPAATAPAETTAPSSASSASKPQATPATKPDASPDTPPEGTDVTPPASETTEPTATAGPSEPVVNPNDATYTVEDPDKRYYFVGLRYRGTVIPKFIENLFVDEGGTFYSNSIGAEIDIRKGNNSMIPSVTYTSYGTGDTLFLEKGKDATLAQNYSIVNSGLGAIYLGLDELWSVPIANHWDFEFGFGVGIGVVFGSLLNNWVYEVPSGTPGSLTASNGRTYRQCQTEGNSFGSLSSGCARGTHTGATVGKVGGYTEPNWFNGGSIPVVFPQITFPNIGVRYKPIKQFEARVGLGFSLTGFWFGLSGDYGLEKADQSATPKTKPQDKPEPEKQAPVKTEEKASRANGAASPWHELL